jgi:hypothetical protein
MLTCSLRRHYPDRFRRSVTRLRLQHRHPLSPLYGASSRGDSYRVNDNAFSRFVYTGG